MDIIAFNEASTANGRIESFIENPDSTSGIVTVPKVIASGETVTIPAGRVAVLPNVQIDGVLNVEGEVFIPSGSTFSDLDQRIDTLDSTKVALAAFTGANVNLAVNGYQKLPSGLIIQWGIQSNAALTFPLTFPHVLYSIVVSRAFINDSNTGYPYVRASSVSGASIYFGDQNSMTQTNLGNYTWFAIGY